MIKHIIWGVVVFFSVFVICLTILQLSKVPYIIRFEADNNIKEIIEIGMNLSNLPTNSSIDNVSLGFIDNDYLITLACEDGCAIAFNRTIDSNFLNDSERIATNIVFCIAKCDNKYFFHSRWSK